MRFIGNKENLVARIYGELQTRNIIGKSFFDVFAGTSNVGRFFKKLDYQIYSCDLLYFSFCMQQAYIQNNTIDLFDNLSNILPRKLHENNGNLFDFPINSLEKVIKFLNNCAPIEGFIYNNYSVGGTRQLNQPRMYFSDENAMRIDTIRHQIEYWHQNNHINNNEYYILIACLIESVSFFANVSGIYAAFQKKWDPRAIKPFVLKPIELIINNHNNFVYNTNSHELLHEIAVDIMYLDPPYNERQYAPNYHILETIARNDNPIIHGITGMRDYSKQKSVFCNKTQALQELNYFAKYGNYKFFILSYNSEGIMPQDKILSILQQYGPTELIEFEYARFKSNNKGNNSSKKHIKEQLYILTR